MNKIPAQFFGFCFFLVVHLSGLQAQTDTEFWFVAPEVWAGHGDSPIVLRFATFDEAANITIDQPANPAFPAQILNIAANGTATINLTAWIGMIENKPVNTTLNYGLRIMSDAPITAYYEVNHNNNPDIFTLKGSSALGTEFYTPFQNYLNNNYNESKAGIDVVATEDNTTITIVPTAALIDHPANVAFTISLNAGETYSLRAASTAATAHPGGTHITSSAPIAVTMSDDSIVGTPFGGSCYDLLGDQLIPMSVAGDEYIAVKGVQLGGADRVFLLAAEDNTDISVNGVLAATIDEGETYTHVLGAAVAYYESSSPVIVLHLTGVGCEVGGAILPPLRCTGSRDIAFVRSTNASFSLNLLVQSGSEGDFIFNGNPAFIGAGDFTDVPGASGLWKYAQITTTSFVPTLSASRIQNTSGYFHMGAINGLPAGYCRYGYYSDFAKYEFQTFADDDSLCTGEMANLFTEPIENATYMWSGPEGITSSENTLNFGPVDTTSSGMYIVSGNVGECQITPDTLILSVQDSPEAPAVSWDFFTCEGDDLVLTATTEAESWQWSGPLGDLAENSNVLTVPNAQPTDNGLFTVQSEIEGCFSPETTFLVEITPTQSVALADVSAESCLGSDWSASPQGATGGIDWLWEFPDGTTLDEATLTLTELTESDAGWYFLNAAENGCPWIADSMELNVVAPVDITFDFPPIICSEDDPFALIVNSTEPGNWLASCGNCLDESSGNFNPGLAGIENVEVTFQSLGICQESISDFINVIATPSAAFESVITACLGQGDVAIEAVNSGGNWTSDCGECITPNGLFNTVLAGEGTWSVQYNLTEECPSSALGAFIVTANLSSSFDIPNALCFNAPSLDLVGNIEGGNWSSDCGECLNSNGVFDPSIAGTGLHEINYTIAGLCGSITNELLQVHPIPVTDFTSTPSLGCAPLFIELAGEPQMGAASIAFGILNGNGNTSWITQGENATAILENSDCYDIVYEVIDGNGCTGSTIQNDAICVSAPPLADFTYSPALTESLGSLLQFSANPVNSEWSYQWYVEDEPVSTISEWNFNPSNIDKNPFQICLEVTDSFGCSDYICKDIRTNSDLLVYAPTAFTPDQDGHNDVWRLVFGADVTSMELTVYDRWGKLVFATQDLDHKWLGDVEGGDYLAPDGAYTWSAILRGDEYQVRNIEGHVILIR
jgi:gliding motility-associated-like protein